MKTTFTLLLTFCSVLIMCSSDPETYTVEIIDGVRHVHNHAPLWGDEQRIKLEYVRTIGEIEGDNPNLQFFKPMQIERDSAGNLYVLDSGNHRIQVFDNALNYLRTIGSQGQGPGEFDQPFFMAFAKGKLYVDTGSNNRMEVFSPEGELHDMYRSTARLSSYGVTPEGNIILDQKFTAHGGLDDVVDNMESDTPAIVEIDFDGKTVRSFGKLRQYDNKLMQLFGNMFLYDSASEGGHVLAYAFRNLIEKYDSEGVLIFRADRKLRYEETTEMESYNSPRNRFLRYMQSDSMGRTWSLTFIKPTSIKWAKDDTSPKLVLEIFDETGILLTRIPFPENKNGGLFNILGDRLYFIDLNETMLIYEYRIIE